MYYFNGQILLIKRQQVVGNYRVHEITLHRKDTKKGKMMFGTTPTHTCGIQYPKEEENTHVCNE